MPHADGDGDANDADSLLVTLHVVAKKHTMHHYIYTLVCSRVVGSGVGRSGDKIKPLR